MRRLVVAKVEVTKEVEFAFWVEGDMPEAPGPEGNPASMDREYLRRAAEVAAERWLRKIDYGQDAPEFYAFDVVVERAEGERDHPWVPEGQVVLDVGEEPTFRERWEQMADRLAKMELSG